MNIDVGEEYHSGVRYYEDMLASMGCKNLTNIPTCFSETTRSTVDHVITSIDRDKIKNGVMATAVTDHMPTFALSKNLNDKKHEKNNSLS